MAPEQCRSGTICAAAGKNLKNCSHWEKSVAAGVKSTSGAIQDTMHERNELTADFNNVPYEMTHRAHLQVKARSESGHIITRNVEQCKRIPKPKDDTDNDDDSNGERHQERDNTINPPPETNVQQQPQIPVRRSNRVREKPARFGRSVYEWWTSNLL